MLVPLSQRGREPIWAFGGGLSSFAAPALLTWGGGSLKTGSWVVGLDWITPAALPFRFASIQQTDILKERQKKKREGFLFRLPVPSFALFSFNSLRLRSLNCFIHIDSRLLPLLYDDLPTRRRPRVLRLPPVAQAPEPPPLEYRRDIDAVSPCIPLP